jgi:histone H2A
VAGGFNSTKEPKLLHYFSDPDCTHGTCTPVTMSTTPEERATGGQRRTRVSRTTKAGLQFPIGRIHRYLKNATAVKRVSANAAVYLAATLEYLCAEMVEIAGNIAHDRRKTRITPRHVL